MNTVCCTVAIRFNAAAFVLFEDPDTDKIPAFFCRGEHAVINELAVSLHRDARSFPEHGSPASGRPSVYKDILPRYELLSTASSRSEATDPSRISKAGLTVHCAGGTSSAETLVWRTRTSSRQTISAIFLKM